MIALDKSGVAAVWQRDIVPMARSSKLLRIAVVALVSLFFLSYLGSPRGSRRYRAYIPSEYRFNTSAPSTHIQPFTDAEKHFWELHSYAISRGKPGFAEVRKFPQASDPWQTYDPDNEEKRTDNLEMSAEEFSNLKTGFRAIKKDAKVLGPKLPFQRGTRGIVMTTNNDALSTLITSLRMIRQAGSVLPIEVFLDDYEEPACENILPSLGARCVSILDHLPTEMEHPMEIDHFMSKIAAVLFSSFEQVLLLDMDLFPVNNPDSLFVTEPFISSGLVLWPDYWASTASHYLFELLDIPMTNLTLRATTESGALLVNKATHSEALIAVSYLNRWGPGYWYRLLSQGATGEGDKDTWAAGAAAMGLPFYQVMERPGHVGYRCDGSYRSVASLQHHPLDDWFITQLGINRASKEETLADAPPPRPMFLHGNLPKYDAPTLLNWRIESVDWTDMLRCKDGVVHRLWGPKELTVRKYGWDVEKAVWDSMRWTACEHEMDLRMWVNGTWHSDPVTNVCNDMLKFYAELFPNETYDPTLPRTPRPEREWGGGFVEVY